MRNKSGFTTPGFAFFILSHLLPFRISITKVPVHFLKSRENAEFVTGSLQGHTWRDGSEEKRGFQNILIQVMLHQVVLEKKYCHYWQVWAYGNHSPCPIRIQGFFYKLLKGWWFHTISEVVAITAHVYQVPLCTINTRNGKKNPLSQEFPHNQV